MGEVESVVDVAAVEEFVGVVGTELAAAASTAMAILGDAGLAERARVELLAAGARPRRASLTGADALTASARRVAQLASNGLSNREIAAALFVSRKTVESHLGSVYLKLETNDRRTLGAALINTEDASGVPQLGSAENTSTRLLG